MEKEGGVGGVGGVGGEEQGGFELEERRAPRRVRFE
jgi:hypothetical protein